MNPTEPQIQTMRLALGLSGLPCSDSAAETVLLVVDGINQLGNKFSLKDAAAIEARVHRKYSKPTVTTKKK